MSVFRTSLALGGIRKYHGTRGNPLPFENSSSQTSRPALATADDWDSTPENTKRGHKDLVLVRYFVPGAGLERNSLTVGGAPRHPHKTPRDTPTDTPTANQARGSASRAAACLCPATGRYRTLADLTTAQRFSKCLIRGSDYLFGVFCLRLRTNWRTISFCSSEISDHPSMISAFGVDGIEGAAIRSAL